MSHAGSIAILSCALLRPLLQKRSISRSAT